MSMVFLGGPKDGALYEPTRREEFPRRGVIVWAQEQAESPKADFVYHYSFSEGGHSFYVHNQLVTTCG